MNRPSLTLVIVLAAALCSPATVLSDDDVVLFDSGGFPGMSNLECRQNRVCWSKLGEFLQIEFENGRLQQ